MGCLCAIRVVFQKMIVLFLLAVLVPNVLSQPIDNVDNDEREANILKYDNNDDGYGNHAFSFETSNGISRKEIWYLENAGTPEEHIAVDGQYSYLDPDGKRITIVYHADENGYFAQPEQRPPTRYGGAKPTPQVSSQVIATLLG